MTDLSTVGNVEEIEEQNIKIEALKRDNRCNELTMTDQGKMQTTF